MRNGNINNGYNLNLRKRENTNYREEKTTQNNKNNFIVLLIWMVIAVFLIIQTVQIIRYTLGFIPKEKAPLYNIVDGIVTGIFPYMKGYETEESSVKLAALGDIYISGNVLKNSKSATGYDFTKGTSEVKKILGDYDVVIAPLSTPVTGETASYEEKINAPLEIFDLFNELKVSVVATASYHSMDKLEKGALKTIENIEKNNLKQVGLNKSENEGDPIIITKNNISIGILSYTTNSNVKMGNNDAYVLDYLDEELLNKDIKYLKNKNVDYIVAYLNVKNENEEEPNDIQKQKTEMLFNAGVNVVLGTGTKVVQEETEDMITVNGNDTHIYAVYSLGDFIGDYKTDKNKTSAIANIEFTKKIVKDKKGNVIKEEKDMLTKELVKVSVDNSYNMTLEKVK